VLSALGSWLAYLQGLDGPSRLEGDLAVFDLFLFYFLDVLAYLVHDLEDDAEDEGAVPQTYDAPSAMAPSLGTS
jgi:hypothetical protein